MKWVCLVLILSPSLVLGLSYSETREVVDSAGKTLECEYTVVYTAKGVVNKGKSKVVCTPNTAGKPVQQTFILEDVGQSVTVKHSIKKGKEKITGITKEEYVPPTTTSAPPAEGAMDCACKMPSDSQTGLLTAVRSSVPSALNRQLLGGGLLSNLAGSVTAPSNDLVTQMATQIAQQQIDDFINNGGAEEAITQLLESGQLEQMVTEFIESGQAEEMMSQVMESVDMEAMMGELVETLENQMEESMQNGGFEEMIAGTPLEEMMNMNGGLEELMNMNVGLEELMNMNGGLEELFGNGEGLLSPEMLAEMGDFELHMQCNCSPAA